MRKILGRNYWKRGSAEMVGFIVILPCITFFLVCLASLIQMGMVRSRMEYAAYAACRAAVVSTKDKAQEQAEMVARENTKAAGGAKISLVNVKVERVDPVTGKAASSKKKKKKSSKKASGSDTDWGKGVYVRCTVTCDVKTFTLFTSGRKSSAIVMMVEEGAEDLFDISDYMT